jgi:hypothetical protein
VDFTREPIIETVITPKDGFKLAIRSSKNPAHEEFFVDAVEVVSFGSALFFRSLERPKAFIVPVSDYEVLEVRETRLVLKNVGIDRSIKIAGGREGALKLPPKESSQERESSTQESLSSEDAPKTSTEPKNDRKRDRRRQNRRRRGRDEIVEGSETEEGKDLESPPSDSQVKVKLPLTRTTEGEGTTTLSTLLPPPPMLISETMAQYRNNALFKEAFFLKNEEEQPQETPETDTTAEPHHAEITQPQDEPHTETHTEPPQT